MKKDKSFKETYAEIPKYKWDAYNEIKEKKNIYFRKHLFHSIAPLPMYFLIWFMAVFISVGIYMYIGYFIITTDGLVEAFISAVALKPFLLFWACVIVSLIPMFTLLGLLLIVELYTKWIYRYDKNDKYVKKG